MTQSNKLVLARGIGMAGSVAGIAIAIHRHSGFWGVVGWFFLGGLAGSAIGYVAYAAIPETSTTPAPVVNINVGANGLMADQQAAPVPA